MVSAFPHKKSVAVLAVCAILCVSLSISLWSCSDDHANSVEDKLAQYAAEDASLTAVVNLEKLSQEMQIPLVATNDKERKGPEEITFRDAIIAFTPQFPGLQRVATSLADVLENKYTEKNNVVVVISRRGRNTDMLLLFSVSDDKAFADSYAQEYGYSVEKKGDYRVVCSREQFYAAATKGVGVLVLRDGAPGTVIQSMDIINGFTSHAKMSPVKGWQKEILSGSDAIVALARPEIADLPVISSLASRYPAIAGNMPGNYVSAKVKFQRSAFSVSGELLDTAGKAVPWTTSQIPQQMFSLVPEKPFLVLIAGNATPVIDALRDYAPASMKPTLSMAAKMTNGATMLAISPASGSLEDFLTEPGNPSNWQFRVALGTHGNSASTIVPLVKPLLGNLGTVAEVDVADNAIVLGNIAMTYPGEEISGAKDKDVYVRMNFLRDSVPAKLMGFDFGLDMMFWTKGSQYSFSVDIPGKDVSLVDAALQFTEF